MTLTTHLIHSLETLYFILIVIMLLQVGKLYISSTPPNQKSKYKGTKTQSTGYFNNKPDGNIQKKPTSDHYSYKLPEPEVSISSEHESPPLTHNATSVIRKPHPSKNTAILNGYIDDHFSETQKNNQAEISGSQWNSDTDDEIITITEPSNEIIWGKPSLTINAAMSKN